MRTRTLFDRKGAFAEYVDNELIWLREDRGGEAIVAGTQIIPDIGAYTSMITGQVIDGRKRHRDHLKAYNCVEVGNDMSHMQRKHIPLPSRKESLHRLMADMGDRDVQRIVQQEIRNRR